ncbi:ER/nuclear membrane ubiquitin-protein ligase E3 [Haematococcus lacustris]|uniref:ER/nuclear membrane ubiquitin-protein ligase E3 n=1 Tax=Haematococcus lacustris TaxID=44745 RepID=A0A6A0A9Y6_HAELA|nr:ER/nuclear membrane ubiquitin-protein ligase E3 [Haematococcus lacustris]
MDEEDECRVCRGGAEAGELVAPCKCNGSVRFAHQFCVGLLLWGVLLPFSTTLLFCLAFAPDLAAAQRLVHWLMRDPWHVGQFTLLGVSLAVVITLQQQQEGEEQQQEEEEQQQEGEEEEERKEEEEEEGQQQRQL